MNKYVELLPCHGQRHQQIILVNMTEKLYQKTDITQLVTKFEAKINLFFHSCNSSIPAAAAGMVVVVIVVVHLVAIAGEAFYCSVKVRYLYIGSWLKIQAQYDSGKRQNLQKNYAIELHDKRQVPGYTHTITLASTLKMDVSILHAYTWHYSWRFTGSPSQTAHRPHVPGTTTTPVDVMKCNKFTC